MRVPRKKQSVLKYVIYSPRRNCSREVSLSCSGFTIVRLSVKYFISLLSQ